MTTADRFAGVDPVEFPSAHILVVHGDTVWLESVVDMVASLYSVATATDLDSARTAIDRRTPDLILCQARLLAADGHLVWRRLSDDPRLHVVPLVLVSDDTGTPSGVPEVAADDLVHRPLSRRDLITRIAANVKAAARRRESTAEIVLAHLPFGVTMVDPGGRIVYANPARDRLLQYGSRNAPKVGDRLADRLPARHRDGTPLSPEQYPIRRALKGEFVAELDVQYDAGDGRTHWLRVSGIPVTAADGSVRYAIGVATDISGEMAARLDLVKLTESLEERVQAEITERLKAEEALRQVHKLQALGQLTGGIAHDFNNLLQVMLGNLEAAQRHLNAAAPLDRPRLMRQVAAALEGVERATQLTQQLLAFSRRQPLSPTAIDARKLLADMGELLRRTLGERVSVEIAVAGDLAYIFADRNQLESALLNLAVNARDAMPEGGRLSIKAVNFRRPELEGQPWEEFAAGDYVLITVADTGTGIRADVLPYIFEPFFTTKELGRGTGLGLSQAYGFAKQSGGHIAVESEVGAGTSVRLYLPARSVSDIADDWHESVPVRTAAKGEMILVVEDDSRVRALNSSILRELGYVVVEAVDGPHALLQLEREPRIQLMFTDVGLPGGLTGRQLADAARAMRPGLKVLFTTGYARDAIVHHGRLDPGVELITKPFTADALAARMRQILES